jgi:hypothetical protein
MALPVMQCGGNLKGKREDPSVEGVGEVLNLFFPLKF